MDNEPKYPFDRSKFKEVVHYVCAQCKPNELGNVKLHKILYFSDMIKFVSTGKPMTGVEYQKQQFGPIARYLSSALRELKNEGKIKIEKRDYFGFEKTDYISMKLPQAGLTNEDVQIINDVIAFVCQRSAREISELSHNAAWDAACLGENIPYYSAYGLAPVEVTDADLEIGMREAAIIRPVLYA